MAYVEQVELAERLNIDRPTALQADQMQRVLDEAADGIDWFVGFTVDNPAPSPPPAAVKGANLDLAVEFWHMGQSKGFGLVTVGSEAVFVGTDSWRRWAARLAPYKRQWGVA